MMFAPLLLSAAAGYWVLERAEHQKGRIRTIGRIVAGLILVLSLGGVLCKVTACMQGRGSFCAKGMGGGVKHTCPISGMMGQPEAK